MAGEVKNLAQEAARATEDISSRVAAIRADTGGAVDVINRISEMIAKINAYQTTIASAIEEQTATTAEMSRRISEVASSSNRIAGNISDVAEASAAHRGRPHRRGDARTGGHLPDQLIAEVREVGGRVLVTGRPPLSATLVGAVLTIRPGVATCSARHRC